MPIAIPTTQIGILSHFSGLAPYTGNVPLESVHMLQQLHDSGHLGGTIGTGELTGPDNYVENLHITTEGRLLLIQLQKEQQSSLFLSLNWQWTLTLVVAILGVLATLAAALIQ